MLQVASSIFAAERLGSEFVLAFFGTHAKTLPTG
jgi:hypothetical protein